MARMAVLKDNIVINLIEADQSITSHNGFPVYPSDTADIGWHFYPGINVFGPPDPAPAPVPEEVFPLQMRKALRQSGLKSAADAYLATLDEEVQEEWEYASTIRRDNPFIEGARIALGLTEEQADDLFRLAATL